MRISIGADHAGYELKESIKQALTARGVAVDDVGTYSGDSVDYPDYAAEVAGRVVAGRSDRGILVCGTGIGMAMAANKIGGVRAAPAHDAASARLAREHNDANILALGARLTPTELALELVRIFLETPFEGGRHQRRLDKVTALEGRKG
ncbi:MAG: ribose 5-phosphate isomerase B [Acidobacteria bacterium]|nr:MAG: ribose 5-phosphate isomerase B [Acidobacteriota bacterium]RPJ73718.1 MAG: ribose 5-phosphate isomerase B [Acidobacteriota bacterium]